MPGVSKVSEVPKVSMRCMQSEMPVVSEVPAVSDVPAVSEVPCSVCIQNWMTVRIIQKWMTRIIQNWMIIVRLCSI